MKELIEKVKQWAESRNIIKGSTPIKQHDKLVEEVLELRDAIATDSFFGEIEHTRNKGKISPLEYEIKDGIGDSIVCLINLATMYNMEIEDCLAHAYEEIKDRKGKMIDGTFVKEVQGE